jgi:DNA-binding IclR family transcriptional regulator
MVSTAKLKKQILEHLSEKPMSLKEVAEVMELKEKRTFRLLRSLFEKDEIKKVKGEDGVRRYAKVEEE